MRSVSMDVVVCTYNRAGILDVALESLRHQRVSPGVDWRILVVDNNSVDETLAVVKRHARLAQVPLASVREPRQGIIPARIRGVTSTRLEWIAFIDDDCELADDWIDHAAAFARVHPECGAFGGRVVLAWEEQPPWFADRFGWLWAEQEHGDEPTRVESLVGAGMVVRREALASTGWVEKQFMTASVGESLAGHGGDDVEIAVRIGAAHELWYTPTLRLQHRVPGPRTSYAYVNKMAYNLGTTGLFLQSMLWPGSYHRWLVTSALRSSEYGRGALEHVAKKILRRGQAVEATLMFCFFGGWWTGIWRLARMAPGERAELLGCAAPAKGRPAAQ